MAKKTFHVAWDFDVEADNHEEAALVAAGLLADPANTATIFTATDPKDISVVIDTEGGKAAVIRDERPYPSVPPKPAAVIAETVEHLRLEIQRKLALLRELTKEPVSIRYGEHVDFEVRPAGEDDRLLVGRKDWGHTNVNYTHEGLVVDVWREIQAADGPLEPVATQVFYAEDLQGETA